MSDEHDYLFDEQASQELAANIRRYYARKGIYPRVWVEKERYGAINEKPVTIYVVRSNLGFSVPETAPSQSA